MNRASQFLEDTKNLLGSTLMKKAWEAGGSFSSKNLEGYLEGKLKSYGKLEILFDRYTNFLNFLHSLPVSVVKVSETKLQVQYSNYFVLYGTGRSTYFPFKGFSSDIYEIKDNPHFYLGYPRNTDPFGDVSNDYYVMNDGEVVELHSDWEWSPHSDWTVKGRDIETNLFPKSTRPKKGDHQLSCSDEFGNYRFFIHLDSEGVSVPPSNLLRNSKKIIYTLMFMYSEFLNSVRNEGIKVYDHQTKNIS